MKKKVKTTTYRTIGWIDENTDTVQLDYCGGPPGDDREWACLLEHPASPEEAEEDESYIYTEVVVTEWDDGSFTIT